MEGKEEKHSVNWIANQFDNLSKLRRESKPKFFGVLSYYAIIGISLLLNAFYIPNLNGQIAKLKNDKIDLEKSNTNLEIRLAPFRAVALEKFSGSSENEALSALAERIGQVELQVISLFDYQEVSTWTFVGVTVRQLGGGASTIGNSPAIEWSKNYVQLEDNGKIKEVDCGTEAIKHYLETIQRFELFPFPYYILAKCQQNNNDPQWQVNFGKAYRILSITTRIPGHHPDHDAVLKQITHQ